MSTTSSPSKEDAQHRACPPIFWILLTCYLLALIGTVTWSLFPRYDLSNRIWRYMYNKTMDPTLFGDPRNDEAIPIPYLCEYGWGKEREAHMKIASGDEDADGVRSTGGARPDSQWVRDTSKDIEMRDLNSWKAGRRMLNLNMTWKEKEKMRSQKVLEERDVNEGRKGEGKESMSATERGVGGESCISDVEDVAGAQLNARHERGARKSALDEGWRRLE